MDSFGDFSVNLVLWVWIPEARDRFNIKSDILKALKDSFDLNGVEIPFPYRTSVRKKDLPQPRRLSLEELEDFKSPRRYPSKGKDYFEYGSWMKRTEAPPGFQDSQVRILVPTAGGKQVKKTADFVMKLAKQVDASITALYIVQTPTRKNIERGVWALNEFNLAGKRDGVMVATLIEEGHVIEKILDTIEEKKISLVVMGSSERGPLSRWGKVDVTSEILEQVDIPTVIMPHAPDEEELRQMLKDRYF
jgi:nucleotide-binding universal stress UspA family protein